MRQSNFSVFQQIVRRTCLIYRYTKGQFCPDFKQNFIAFWAQNEAAFAVSLAKKTHSIKVCFATAICRLV